LIGTFGCVEFWHCRSRAAKRSIAPNPPNTRGVFLEDTVSFRNIVVFLDPGPDGTKRAEFAASLAAQHGAHLVGVHVVSACTPNLRTDYYLRGSKAITNWLASVRAKDDDIATAIRRTFEAVAANRGLCTEFRIIGRGGSGDDLTMSSLHSDLAIIGQRQLRELPTYFSSESRFLASGTPILVLPDAWSSDTICTKILVGWNASREVRRAVGDAMPLLTAARSVTVLVVDANDRVVRHGQQPGADIAQHLARHGARVEAGWASSQGSSVANVILNYAVDHDIDLIVIGAYSNARFRQIVFGGVTRSLLNQTSVPMLMSR